MNSGTILTICLLTAGVTSAQTPCTSGPQLGQRPGPYSFLVASGPQKGQQTCYVCETDVKPGIIIFSRSLAEPLSKLLVKCDEFVNSKPKESIYGWMTVLGEKTVPLDELGKWTKQAGIKTMPTGVFDDPVGPPTYKLSDQADVTVLLFVNKKVIANFAFRAGELDNEAIKRITEQLPKLTEKK